MAWTFTVSGSPAQNNYFIVTTAQSAAVTVGNLFTDTANPGQVFGVTLIGTPFAGFVNISFTPNAVTAMNNPDVVTQFQPSTLTEMAMFP